MNQTYRERNMMMKILLAASASIVALGAQAADLPQKYVDAGKVVVANVPNYPPMEFRDPATNELVGVDIELGKALAKQLGTTFEWSEIPFVQMMSALKTDRADMVLSGMSDLPSRRETLDFVDYMRSGAQFFILAKNADKYKEPADLCGKSVGMSRSTSFPDEAKKWSAVHCEGQGKPALQIVGTEGSADARTQLRQGRVDGAVQGSETLPYLMKLDSGTYALIGKPFTAVHQGMGFAKDNPELRDAVAAALAKLMASGEYKTVFEKYGLGGTMLDKVLINGEAVK
jgi:polar amino acid transport system substrate-binding protein